MEASRNDTAGSTDLLMTADIIQYPWYPRGVKRIISSGSICYVGEVDDSSVLKYPCLPTLEKMDFNKQPPGAAKYYEYSRQQQLHALEVERRILERLGENPRIVKYKGQHEDGILLEYQRCGSLADRLFGKDPRPASLAERLKWAVQAAQGLAYVHSKAVLHCDPSIGNILLDSSLNACLTDFQGQLLDPVDRGNILLDGYSAPSLKSTMPNCPAESADPRTDIFALASTVYQIVSGQSVFPELDDTRDEEEIQARFERGEFPSLDDEKGGEVLQRAWQGNYRDAAEFAKDMEKVLKALQKKIAASAG